MTGSKNFLFKIYKKCRDKANGGHGIGFGKSYIGKKIINSTNDMLKPDYCTIQGHKMFLDKHDSLDLSLNQEYGVLETKIIKDEVKLGDNVIDLGAHIGYYTLLLAKSIGSNGKVFAFEPEPSNFSILQKNISENNYTNVISEQKAVSDSNSKINFWIGQNSSGANRIYKPAKTNTQKFKLSTVDCIKLDDYFSKSEFFNKINFIKMDLEGAEYNALLGMRSLLENNTKISILTEFSPNSLYDAGTSPSKFFDLFLDLGFELFHLDDVSKKIILIEKNDLLEINSTNQVINLLCKKQTEK
tara:strand:- start:6622 stop:7521 length:900 start_codon:yes stop_codon:yes gene_type:complete